MKANEIKRAQMLLATNKEFSDITKAMSVLTVLMDKHAEKCEVPVLYLIFLGALGMLNTGIDDIKEYYKEDLSKNFGIENYNLPYIKELTKS